MFKKIITAVIAAAMIASSIPVMAHTGSTVTAYSDTVTMEVSLFDKSDKAVILGEQEEDAFYSFISQKIDKLQKKDEVCEVVVDELAQFNLKFNISDESVKEDTDKISDTYMQLVKKYNISEATGKRTDDNILEQLTFKIDNSMSTDEAVAIMAEKAEERSKRDSFSNDTEEFAQIPIALFINNSSEILSKYQFAHPELCYVPSSAGMSLGASYSQMGKEVNFTTKSFVSVKYLPISYEEYMAFQTKLQAIVDKVVAPQMNDAQKAMALQDWIIENTAYGYALGKDLYPPQLADESNIVIYNIGEYDTLIDLMNSEEMKLSRTYSHTAYAPAMLGYGVCQGYTMLYSALLNKVGIENGTYISNAMNHQWNSVKIDDLWYHSDITWNDPTPSESDTDSYDVIELSLTDGSQHKLKYQTKNYHSYLNLFMSDAKCAENHTFADGDIMIPEAECNDNKFHEVTVIGDEEYSSYAMQDIWYTQLNYSKKDNMYYYERPVIFNGEPTTWYYKTPFKLLQEDGTYVQPTKIEKDEYDAVLNETDITPEKDFVTVKIPDGTVINNSIDVECLVYGKEGDQLSIENIGTAVVKITAKTGEQPETQTAPTAVDAYLVYYGENNTVVKIYAKNVKIDDKGEVKFEQQCPDGAVSAKIIILDAESELTPVIKALGVELTADNAA